MTMLCSLALGAAKGLREEDIYAFPEVDVHRTNEDAGRLLNCQSDSRDPTDDHFVYESLQRVAGCIRLVEILPPHANGIVRCPIKHTEIGHPCVPIEYRAESGRESESEINRNGARSSQAGTGQAETPG
jgi:hypothetical protein